MLKIQPHDPVLPADRRRIDSVADSAELNLDEAFCVSIEGVSVDELIRAHRSPLFVYSERMARSTYRRLHQAFASRYPRVQLAWSYKTNYLKAICSLMHQEGAFAEVVSRMEYEKAKSLAVPGKRIVFNGPNKPLDLLRVAAEDGAIIHVDHLDEIHDLEIVAAQLGRKLSVGLRVNLDCGLSPAWNRFGFHLESGQAHEAVAQIYASGQLALTGLHCHIGTSVVQVDAYRQAVCKLVAFGYEMRERFGATIETLDIGGGFASSAVLKDSQVAAEPTPSFDDYAEAICDSLHASLEPGHQPLLIIESGRALIDDAGSLVTSIVASKQLPDGTPAYVADAGINLLFTANQYCYDVTLVGEPHGTPVRSVLYGPLCMNTDEIASDVTLPPLERGARLIISPVGAYNNTLWSQFIEYRPRIVMICEDQSVVLMREAEDLSDIERREHLPPQFACKGFASPP
jgi:diaminopimelate decarboxylase